MTGYGRATAALDGFSITVQVSSVNRKSLDLTLKLPDAWESLEPAVGELVRKYAARGKVHVDIEVTGDPNATEATWDEPAAAAALQKLRAFAAAQGVEFRPGAELLWAVANAQRRATEFPAAEAAQATVTEALTTALRAFAAMRAKEGEALLVDFIQRTAALQRNVEAIAHRAPEVSAGYRDQLMKRLREAG
jgi:uncharacterized protein (TIGR00255 family)